MRGERLAPCGEPRFPAPAVSLTLPLMAGEDLGAAPEGEGTSGSWRGVAASAGALLATILLAALLFMVDASNDTRDQALASERHSYDVMLLTRTVDASIARAEAALGRYVLDEQQTTGSVYVNEWQSAAQQIGELQRLVGDNRQQGARVGQLRRLYDRHGQELAAAAAAAQGKKGIGGINLFFQA